MIPKETWKPVYDGSYSVSNLGRVRRNARALGFFSGKILSPEKTKSGYLRVSMSFSGIAVRKAIHVLVAGAFLGPHPSRRRFVNHRDSDRENNRPENLEYVTHKQNMRHAVMNGRMPRGEENHWSKLTREQVLQIKTAMKLGAAQAKIARRFRVSEAAINHIRLGHSWRHVVCHMGRRRHGPSVSVRVSATLMKRLALLQKQSLMTMRMQMETVIKVGLQSMKHARRRRK